MVFSMHRLVLAASIVVMLGRVFADNLEEVQEEGEMMENDEDEVGDHDEEGHSQGDALEEFDEDGDEKISLDEIMGALLGSLPDENEQGPEQVLEDARFINATVPTLFGQVDDGDGFLSEDEVLVLLDKFDAAYKESLKGSSTGEL
eukprot:TRINITY_DN7374_c0_g3_i1.p1 TRINITY_DN7374_c0_g3~~TRINITY_DN7374_c0_g3_i1.p1  ORF type:complete len:146 (-),score=35.23 TRINITY_DN7374_c0_g3_i1:75-512(-)